MISKEMAERFVVKLRQETGLYVDVINEKGIVQASLDTKKIGSFHKIAYDFMKGNLQKMDVEKDLPNLGIAQGVLRKVEENHKCVGVVSVSGVPEQIEHMAAVVKLAMETMLEYEAKYENFHKYNSNRDIFNQALMYGERISPDVLISRAERLGIWTDCLRISMFIVAEPKKDFSRLIDASRENPFSHEQDIVASSRSNRIAVFKYLEQDKDILTSYRNQVEEYLKWWNREFIAVNVQAQFNIGTIQDKLWRYREAYQHAVWLVTNAKCQGHINWFYDYTDEYFRSMVSNEIYQNVFQTFAEQLDDNLMEYLPDLIQTLEDCNYNFNQASQKMFIHKNTIGFRLDKVKSCLNINPVKNPKDRDFLNNFLYYVKQHS